jgi:hypothetical protein
MKGIEKDLRDMSIHALTRAFNELGSLRCDFAVEQVGTGKSDTYALDAIPEETIKAEVDNYDRDIVLVTEETGKMYSGELGLEPTQTVLICDPTDRSIKMHEFLLKLIADIPTVAKATVNEAFTSHADRWRTELGDPTISGASASITAIRDRRILFNVMVNYVTGELFTADSVGTRTTKISDRSTEGPLKFSAADRHSRRFVTFLGKEGYAENMDKCNLGLKADDCADPWTGGPLRILSLSDAGQKDVSFILSNGEKICEWVGWLSWVKYARDPLQSDERALHAFRLFFESPRTKELVLVAPGPHYSIFIEEDGETRVNLDRMFQLADPSHYRETILITPKENVGAISRVRSLGKYQKELKL